MIKARWYFDLISPFSYLHLKQFHRLPDEIEIEYVPVLFAGLLKHWGHKGPAEIPAKRVYTYHHVNWLAKHLDIPFKVPPCHPFNSLYALRLLIAAGLTHAHVAVAFDMIWREGCDLQSPEALTELARRLGITSVENALADEQIKQQLRTNTDGAIQQGLFGVPTFVINEVLFWGQDSLDMMLDYLRDPGLFETHEMQRASSLPVGAARLQSRV